MRNRKWLGDIGFAVLLALPTAALTRPQITGSNDRPARPYRQRGPEPLLPNIRQCCTASACPAKLPSRSSHCAPWASEIESSTGVL